MATVADLVLRVEEILYGTEVWERPDTDLLNGAITDSATSMLVDTDIWRRQDYAEFAAADGTPGEIVFVRAYNTSTNTATVERGQRGSTAAAQSDNAVIRRNPVITRQAIDQKLQEMIDTPGRLWPHVWTWYQGSLTFTTDDHLYDLPQYIEDVVAVYQSDVDSDGQFAPIDSGHWEVIRQLSTSVTANKTLLRLADVWDENTTVYYTGKRRPFYADIANIDATLANMLPRAVAGLLLMDRGPQIDGSSRKAGRDRGTNLFSYGQSLYEQFRRDLDEYRRALTVEHAKEPNFKRRMSARW